MTDRIPGVGWHSLSSLREVLHKQEPSSVLDERIHAAVNAWSNVRSGSLNRHIIRWPVALATAASVSLIALTLHHASEDRGAAVHIPREPHVARGAPRPIAEPAIFRVRAALGSSAAAHRENANFVTGEDFWVDVGVASDGSLQIVRVVPASGVDTFVP